MDDDLSIRPMTDDDVADAARLTRQYLDVHWSQQMYLAELSDMYKRYFVACERGRVIGFVGAHFVLDNADITNIVVDANCRRKGVGRALLNALIDHAKNQQIVSLTLEVAEYNTTAVAFYQQQGFVQNGYRKAYYTNGSGALLLIKRL